MNGETFLPLSLFNVCFSNVSIPPKAVPAMHLPYKEGKHGARQAKRHTTVRPRGFNRRRRTQIASCRFFPYRCLGEGQGWGGWGLGECRSDGAAAKVGIVRAVVSGTLHCGRWRTAGGTRTAIC